MPDTRGFRRSLFVFGVLACMALTGCEEEPEIQSADQPATAGEMQFELKDYQLHYLELTDDDGDVLEFTDPVLAVGVEITNVGEDSFEYQPPHEARELSQDRHPMLYAGFDQPAEIDWETFDPGEPIPGVELADGRWDQQQHDHKTLGADEQLVDYYLFEPPEDGESLLLSMPPRMHRAEVPAFIQFDYTEPEPEGRTIYEVGDAIEFDGVVFEITEITQEYAEIKEDEEEGFSDEPVLKIHYTIENDTDDPIEYDAKHDTLRLDEGPLIQSTDPRFERIRAPGERELVGQKQDVEIEPGETIDDYAVFDRPDGVADNATFFLPARYFERSGTVRVNFSYEPEDVETPEELEEDD